MPDPLTPEPVNPQRLAERLAADPDALTGADFAEAIESTRRFLRTRFHFISPEDLDDVTQLVMVRYLKLGEEGKLDPHLNPGSYLLRAAQWTALDYLRQQRQRREVPLDPASFPETAHDDEVSANLDHAATADTVRRALAIAREANDHTAYKVVVTFLDETDRTGSRPSNRAVAAQLDLSHTGVAKALDRFRAYVASAEAELGHAPPPKHV